jgi:glycosyltransferase involved in cell wall biosynthesis
MERIWHRVCAGRSDLSANSQMAARPAGTGITVVIPAFRARDTIERAVESVAQQPGIDLEIIVIIDDGCIETRERVEQLRLTCCRVLMNACNLGAQATRNRGLAEASKRFILFLDGDDFLSGEVLRGLLNAAEQSEADLALGPWRSLTNEGELLHIRVPQPASPATIFWRWLVDRSWVASGAVLWRTEFARAIGGWDVRVHRNQDGEIVLRGIARGARLAFSREGAAVYNQHDAEHRVTRSFRNLYSLLDVAEFLLEIDGVIPRRERQAAISRYLYDAAVDACGHNDDFATKAFARSRELGFHGYRGGRIGRRGSMLLGPGRYYRLARLARQRWVLLWQSRLLSTSTNR